MAKNEQQELMFKMLQLIETEIKGLHEKVDCLLNTPLTQHVPNQIPHEDMQPPISTVQQAIDGEQSETEVPLYIPPIPTPQVKIDDGLASWERPKPIGEVKPKKKGINFNRLLILMGAIILVVIFFTYGIPWINYFSAPR